MFESIKKLFQKKPEPERDSMFFYDHEMPTGTHYQMGDLWFELDDSNRVVKQHVWNKDKQWKEIHLEGDK